MIKSTSTAPPTLALWQPDMTNSWSHAPRRAHRRLQVRNCFSAGLTVRAIGQRLTRLRTARTAKPRRTGSVNREVISM